MTKKQVKRKKVLILCTGNSCRSQMAEGLVNNLIGDEWKAYSAGTKPSGYVHPMAIKAMAELGIDISSNQSKSTDVYRDVTFDRVITVCDNAARNCPAWLGVGIVRHIGFPDPAEVEGTEEERMAVFRQVRDGLREQIISYLKSDSSAVEVYLNAP
jgi:arsenate reductase